MVLSVSTGTSAWTATARKPRISPPAGPIAVAPTSTPRSASSTTLISPCPPGPWVKPREDCSSLVIPVRTRQPGVAGLLLGQPDAADLGIGEGRVRDRVVARRRARPGRGCRAARPPTGTSRRA